MAIVEIVTFPKKERSYCQSIVTMTSLGAFHSSCFLTPRGFFVGF